MSEKRPLDFPLWASDTNYPAGSDPWSGSATKVTPGGAIVAGGHVPGQRAPAQWENYLKNLSAKWFRYLGDIQVQNWSDTVEAPTNLLGHALAFDASKNILSTDGNNTGMWYSDDYGTTWNASTMSGVGSDNMVINAMASKGNGTVVALGQMVSGSVLHFRYSTDGGVQWTQSSPMPGATDRSIVDVCWDPVNSLFIAVGTIDTGTSDPYLITSPDGITWTQRTTTGPSDGPIWRVTHNGAGVLRAVSSNVVWSSTNGTSWTRNAATLPKASGLVYSADEALWVAMVTGTIGTPKGHVYTSADGITWTEGQSFTSVVPSGWPYVGELAVNGSLFVAIIRPDDGTISTEPNVCRIAYSTDRCVTWKLSSCTTRGRGRDIIFVPSNAFGGREFYISTWNEGNTKARVTRSLRVGQSTVQLP